MNIKFKIKTISGAEYISLAPASIDMDNNPTFEDLDLYLIDFLSKFTTVQCVESNEINNDLLPFELEDKIVKRGSISVYTSKIESHTFIRSYPDIE